MALNQQLPQRHFKAPTRPIPPDSRKVVGVSNLLAMRLDLRSTGDDYRLATMEMGDGAGGRVVVWAALVQGAYRAPGIANVTRRRLFIRSRLSRPSDTSRNRAKDAPVFRHGDFPWS